MQYQLDLVYGTTKCEQEEEKIDYEKIQDCEFQDETVSNYF